MTISGTTLAFSKIVGTGNDFLFIDARQPLPGAFAGLSRPELARKLCDRHFGPGADGLVFMEAGSDSRRLKWDFYNSDGSEAEMCGNATRCVGRWAHRYLGVTSTELETRVGRVEITVDGDTVSSRLGFVRVEFKKFSYDVDGARKNAVLVNTGVPHAVVDIDDLKLVRDRSADIRALRFHPETGPRGANVTFLQRISPSTFATVSFERGVEDFTLSCGTGVLAAAAVGLEGSGLSEAAVKTPGGELAVRFESAREGAVLSGPARFLFEGILSEELVR